MEENQSEIQRITQRSLTNETSQVNAFISDLKNAGANPGTTMKILSEKLAIDRLQSRELVFSSPSWSHLGGSDHNPFTEEFLKIIAIEADEINLVAGKIVSVKIDLNKDSKNKGK